MKFLLDTNAAIALEDSEVLRSAAAALSRYCEQHGVQRYVAAPNFDDIGRDKDESRRAMMLSKLGKFPRLDDVAIMHDGKMERAFGPANLVQPAP